MRRQTVTLNGPSRSRATLLLIALTMVVSACSPKLPDDARRGLIALHQHGCHGCHTIPGVVGSARHVGPPLSGMGRRALIAGRLPNTPDNMIAWIQAPQRIDPASAMPSMGVSDNSARDMAAYLARLD